MSLSNAPIPHMPAGEFMVVHFMSPHDRRTHIDRINPLNGCSPSDGTGAHGPYTPPPLQTDNVTGVPLWCQFPA